MPALLVIASLTACTAPSWDDAAKSGEAGMWAALMEGNRPAYPAESVSTRVSGRCVVEVLVGKDGTVEAVRSIETPDRFIEREVASTISKWRFHPTVVDGTLLAIQGKITYYFMLNDAGPQVQTAGERAAILRAAASEGATQVR